MLRSASQVSIDDEILEYLAHCARKYRLQEKIAFNTTVASAEYDEAQ